MQDYFSSVCKTKFSHSSITAFEYSTFGVMTAHRSEFFSRHSTLARHCKLHQGLAFAWLELNLSNTCDNSGRNSSSERFGVENAISPAKTQVLESIDDVRLWRRAAIVAGERVGFVPTMGALHEGHLSLMRAARKECDRVIGSIFVNPLQFAPNEDFGKYPRTFEKDLELMAQEGVDAVFYPNEKEMYPEGRESVTRVVPPSELADCLEGHFRPGFFTGVATVVAKLFNIVLPEAAFFGEKDYQQMLVIKRMVKDLNLPIQVTAVPTVREKDGLALSSRNVYLSEDERKFAPLLQQTLCTVKESAQSGKVSLQTALEQGRKTLNSVNGLQLQYLEARHGETFQPITEFELPTVILLAAKLQSVRLIDNVVAR